MTLLAAASLATAQESYIIDSVCVGAERTYRINGEPGSTWIWKLHAADSTQIALSNPAGTDFEDIDSNGDSIWGSEITIPWDVEPGIYDLSTEQTSIFGCINHELGQVEVIPGAGAIAGDDLIAFGTA